MAEPTFLSRDIDYLGELGAHLRGLTGYRTLAHELIQNADDVKGDDNGFGGADEMTFDVRTDALVVENNGVFKACEDVTRDECRWADDGGRRCDFHRFRRIAAGDKRLEAGTTGAFGVGFISVYQVTDRPEVLSAARHWRLHEEQPPDKRIEVCPGCEACRASNLPGTRFILPWASDPNSVLRTRLQVMEVSAEAPRLLAEELQAILPGAMLFLRRLKSLVLKRDGKLLRRYERIDEGKSIILSDGEAANDTIWHLLTGDYSEWADKLRASHPGRIEAKRKAEVTIAIDASLASPGVLWAWLPTEHGLGLPFHLNADFFPTIDRKRILFDKDYQAEWNRLAIRAAASVLAGNVEWLTQQLGPVKFWTLVKAVREAAESGTTGDEARPFWSSLAERLRSAPTVFTTGNQWTLPANVHLLQSSDEAAAIGVLNGLGIELVHEDLRPFQPLIREVLGVPLLEVAHVASALTAAGLTRSREAVDAALPSCLAGEGWAQLWTELALLLNRRQSQHRAKAADEDLLRPLAIAPTRNGSLSACRDVYDGDASTIRLFGKIATGINFVAHNAAFQPLRHLCPRFDVHAAAAVLGHAAELKTAWKAEPELLTDLFSWFENHRSMIVASKELTAKIAGLPIFPSAGMLRTLDEVALPGGFEDPIGLTDLVDIGALGGRREFLVDLGMRALDINTYVAERVPTRLRKCDVAPEKLRRLLTLLSTHLGEFVGNTTARTALSGVRMVEGTDEAFHAAASCYFDTPTVRECLGDRYPIVKLPGGDVAALRDLLNWLGVSEVPRLDDLCAVVKSIVAIPFNVEAAPKIRVLFEHLATRVRTGDNPPELEFLTKTAWLPARGKADRWYAPRELYASYQAYLFESQGLFLDIPPGVQNGARPLVEFLGIHATPETLLVVMHLLSSVEQGIAVNKEVYRFLSEQAADPSILQLSKNPCLWIEGEYRSPRDVFWQPHPFGSYRTRLSQDFAVYRALLDRLFVQDSPTPADAVGVIQEIGERFGATNTTLDDEAHAVIMASWQFLERAFDDETDLPPSELALLANTKCVPNAELLLMPPAWMFFENRAGMAAKFDGFLATNVIPRPIGASRAMASAGVQSLGAAVRLEVLELVDLVDDTEITNRLTNRRESIIRVLETHSSSGTSILEALDRLDGLACQRCESAKIRYRLRAFNREVTSRDESVPALFNPLTRTLIVVAGGGKVSWPAVARELATALLPEEDPGRIAAGLKEVLAANDDDEARVALDELGFARLQEEHAAPAPAPEAVGTLGHDVLLPEGGTRAEPRYTAPAQAPDTSGGNGVVAQTPGTSTPPSGAEIQTSTTSKPRRQAGRRGREYWRSYVVSANPNAQPADPDPDPQRHTTETDRAGIARVLEFELQAGRFPTEMPHGNPGYDVESADAEGHIVRYIEVKSCTGSWNDTFAVLSAPQFKKANSMDDEFWLYVVERAQREDFRIHRIPNPSLNATEFMFDSGWSALGEEPEYPPPPEIL